MTPESFLHKINGPFYLRWLLFTRLPVAWFAGISVKSCTAEEAVVRLPYGWRSRNPFRSIYFAAQCAAGELATGILAMAHLQGQPPVSMLVADVQAEFHKKAADTLLFTCQDGAAIKKTIEQAVSDGAAHRFTATATGRLPDGAVACVMKITWSFKSR